MNVGSSETILNGRVMNGRTHQEEDGSYESLDLVTVGTGGEVVLSTDRGVYTLIKGDDSEHTGALEGWARVDRQSAALGVTTLVLLERTRSGTPFRTPRVVIERGIEVGVVDPLFEHTNVIQSLGVVANIAYRSAEDGAASEQTRREEVML